MIHRRRAAATVACSALLLAAGWGGANLEAASASPLTVRTTTLKNGVRVVLAPDSAAMITQVTVCIDAGLGAERKDQSGIGQVAGLLIGRAAGDDDADLASLDSDPVSTTGPDDFCMETTVPEELLGRVLEREAARLRRSDFDEKVFDAAVGEVRSQRRAAALNPVVAGIARLNALAFKGHPYERPLFGLDRDDAHLSAEASRRYLREATRPTRVVVVIAGHFDPDAALALARKSFEGQSGPATPARAVAAVPKPANAGRDTIRMATSSPLVIVGWTCPAASRNDAAALEVLARAISSGPESRIAEGLVSDRKTFLRAEGHLDVRHDASMLFCVAIPARDADGVVVEERMCAAAEWLATARLEDDALDRAKRQAEAAFALRIQPARGMARALAFAELAEGGAATMLARFDALRRVTAEDVQRVAARVLQPAGRVVVWVMPQGAADSGGRP